MVFLKESIIDSLLIHLSAFNRYSTTLCVLGAHMIPCINFDTNSELGRAPALYFVMIDGDMPGLILTKCTS